MRHPREGEESLNDVRFKIAWHTSVGAACMVLANGVWGYFCEMPFPANAFDTAYAMDHRGVV